MIILPKADIRKTYNTVEFVTISKMRNMKGCREKIVSK